VTQRRGSVGGSVGGWKTDGHAVTKAPMSGSRAGSIARTIVGMRAARMMVGDGVPELGRTSGRTLHELMRSGAL
jgi:hypothetical protein